MRNFMIVDTEKTYNIGVVIFNKEIVFKRQYVVKENFEDRKICGEQNYNRKKVLFDNDKNVEYGNAVEICTKLSELAQKYNIEAIFAHNAAEDRISITNLYKQCQAYCSAQNILDMTKLVDTVKIVKFLYPNNVYTSLEDTVNDILGTSLRQVHTALDDCIWLSCILTPLSEYLDLYTRAEYFMNNLKDNAIIDIINFFPKEEEITDSKLFNCISLADEAEYTIKTLNTRLKELVEQNVFIVREQPKLGKNGQILKTTEKAYRLTEFGKDIINRLQDFQRNDFQSKIENTARTLLLPYVNSNQQEDLKLFKESIEAQLNTEYADKFKRLEEEKNNLETLKSNIRKELEEEFENVEKTAAYKRLEKEKELEIQYKKKENDLTNKYNVLTQSFLQPAEDLLDVLYDKKNKKCINELIKQYNNKILTKQELISKLLNLPHTDIKSIKISQASSVRKTLAIISACFGLGLTGLPSFIAGDWVLGLICLGIVVVTPESLMGLGFLAAGIILPIISIKKMK